MPYDEVLLQYTLHKLDQMIDIVAALDDRTANSAPGVPGANTPYVLLTHCLGMMRWWSSDCVRAIPTGRVRAQEFISTGPVAEPVARAAGVRQAYADDVRAVDPYAAPLAPPPRDPEPWMATNHGVFLHVFEEICQHLGHLEITRDLLQARA